ncbi:MAG: hypothetical protein LIO81_10185 [Clostridiales bacterium]|nr:hypothetical protein [Clostridiales bacterium]
MTDRIRRIYNVVKDGNDNKLSISIEQMTYVTEGLKAHAGYADLVKRARAYAYYLDNRTIFIEDDQLLAGYTSAKRFAMEFIPRSSAWPDDDFDNILASGIRIDPEDRKKLRAMDDYWYKTGQSFGERECYYYDEDRMWDFRRRGVQAPRYPDKVTGFGSYGMGGGWGLQYYGGLMCPDFKMHLYTGLETYLEEAKKRKKELRFFDLDALKKYEFYDAAITALEAYLRHCNRYADLCDKMADEKQFTDPGRAAELRLMAENCRRVPAKGARTFWEGLQAITFYWCQFANGQMPLGGRVDMMLWPLLKSDLENGRITREKAKELLQCFRLKIFDFCYIGGIPDQREKWAGKARWNNIVIGGCDNDGNDATNDLTYMFLECSKELHLPHPTLSLRVSEQTPDELMILAMECVKEGVGYPCFISEKEYINYIINNSDVDIREAREFALNGCIDIALPGRSRQTGVPMIVTPIMLEFAINGGKDELMGTEIGVKTKTLDECSSYEEFYNDCFLPQVQKLLETGIEACIVRHGAWREHTQDVMMAIFYEGSLDDCEDIYWKKMKFESSIGVNVVGMVTVIDSLAAIKKVCFDDKDATPAELNAALHANWEGYEELRKKCIAAPKYGNAIDYVDAIGEKLWNDMRDISRQYHGSFGNPVLLSGVSITTHGPAGKITGATPDGRYYGEVLSDASASPAQGRDVSGPLAVFRSAMRMGEGWSSVLHNMKFCPSALKTSSDLEKLGNAVKTYLTNGGHQIQFNVVDQETLIDAKENPDKHGDLIVRVAGYSAYFTDLTSAIQTDVINRMSIDKIR